MIRNACRAALQLVADLFMGLLFLVRAIVFGAARFFVNQWNQYNAFGQFLFLLALFTLSVDAAVAYQYGVSMTKLHGFGFAAIAIAFCVLPDVAVSEGRKGNKGGAWAMGIGSGLLFFVALQSHVGYGGGVRLKEMQQTGFQHAKATDVRKSAASEEANLETWRKSLATKQDELASLKEAAGFVTSVNADGLETELANVRERMVAEEKGARGRKAGRGAEFERLQNRATEITKQLDAVKRFNALSDEVKGLETQIKQTQAIIDAKVQKVADTGFESNVVVNQNDIIVGIVNVAMGLRGEEAIQPTAVQRAVANTAITGFNSLGFLIASPLLMIAAGFNRVTGFGHAGGSSVPMPPPPVNSSVPSVPSAPVSSPNMAAVMARRDGVRKALVGMRQSRVDAGLILAGETAAGVLRAA